MRLILRTRSQAPGILSIAVDKESHLALVLHGVNLNSKSAHFPLIYTVSTELDKGQSTVQSV